ncbi:MAG: peptidylprolyl isomerase [Oscillospiraceae bacterium]|nr:peptidylprolyl isomerase [Oscillospiraceae bacterium]
MSASQEKKRRREERADGVVESKKAKRVNTAKIKKRNSIIKSVVATVVVVLLIVAIIFNSTLFTANMTALAIGEHDYTAVEFNYYYQTAFITTYNNLYSQYGEYTSYILNGNSPLEDQQYSETQSWDDYFEETALKSMQQSAMLYDAAIAEGHTLTSDEQASIDATLTAAKSAAAEQGFGTFKQYLTAYYGKGFSEEIYMDIITRQTMAGSYSNALVERFGEQYTDEQLLAKYDTVRDDYDLISYCYYFVDGAADAENGIDADTAMNKAYSIAQEIASAKTEEDFAALVAENCSEEEKATFADPAAVQRNNIAPSAISSMYVDWLTDPARQYGDSTYGEGTNGYYVVLFVDRNDNSFNAQSFRHILIQTQKDENGELTGEAALAAQGEAKSLLDKWAEDPTEDNFAAMANEHSEDGGSNTTGGLYENVIYGQMVPEIEKWLFDSARKPGDTDVVYVTSTNYSGAHVLYYVGEGEQYNITLADNLQKQEDYDNWMNEREPDYAVKTKFAFRFAK